MKKLFLLLAVLASSTLMAQDYSWKSSKIDGSRTGVVTPSKDNISETIAQKPFDHAIFRNDVFRVDGIYEVHPNMYLTLAFEYNNARAFDNLKTDALPSEDIGTAQYYLDKYMPRYYQGKNFTVSAAFSFGF